MLACNKLIFVGFETINFEFPVHVLTTKLTQHENTFIIPFIVQTLPHKLSLSPSRRSQTLDEFLDLPDLHISVRRVRIICHLQSYNSGEKAPLKPECACVLAPGDRWPGALFALQGPLTKRTTKYHGITLISDAYPGGVIVFFEVS